MPCCISISDIIDPFDLSTPLPSLQHKKCCDNGDSARSGVRAGDGLCTIVLDLFGDLRDGDGWSKTVKNLAVFEC